MDRQIFQLTARSLSAGDVIATQTSDGSTGAGKNTITTVKAAMTLDQVDNTSDINKPVSTLQAAADSAVAATAAGLIAAKQDILVSGTNIKSLNGAPLLGSGDITTTVVKEYIALLSQTSTTAPTLVGTAIKIGFTGTFSFSFTSTGLFTINNSVAEFTAGKTFVEFTNGLTQPGTMGFGYGSTTVVSINSRDASGTLANALMTSTRVRVVVYP